MHVWQVRLAQTTVDLLQQLASLGRTAEFRHEFCGLVDTQEKAAVDLPVIGLAEVVLDAVVDDPFQVTRRVARGQPQRSVLLKVRTELVLSIMIGPHEGELHAIAVLSVEKALFQGLLHILHAAVPVPVVEKHVDSMIGGKIDLSRRPFRVAFVEITPGRLERLLVSGESRNRGLHALPFGPAFAFPGGAMVVVVPVGVIDAHDGRPMLAGILGRMGDRRTGEDGQTRGQSDNAFL